MSNAAYEAIVERRRQLAIRKRGLTPSNSHQKSLRDVLEQSNHRTQQDSNDTVDGAAEMIRTGEAIGADEVNEEN